MEEKENNNSLAEIHRAEGEHMKVGDLVNYLNTFPEDWDIYIVGGPEKCDLYNLDTVTANYSARGVDFICGCKSLD